MQKHFQTIRNDYNGGHTVTLNLIQRAKALEKLLLDEYEKVLGESGLLHDRVHYYHFDFHVECHENSTPMMDYIS